MRRLQTALLVLFALTTLGAGYLAWSQSREIADLKQALATAAAPKVEARKRAWRESAAATAAETDAADAPAEGRGPGEGPPANGPEMRRRGEAGFRAMMDNPEYQKLMAVEQKGRLDQRYAALFKKLGLTPEQLDKFKDLLVEKQTAMLDVMMAARAQGLNPRTDPDGFRALVTSTQNDIESSIRSALGDQAYSTYQDYEHTLPYRNVVDQLDSRLSYSASPLTDAQSEQLVQALAGAHPNNATAQNPVREAIGPMFGRTPQGALNNQAMSMAQGILTPDQYGALQQLQQEQQAQSQMRNLMREQFSPAPAAKASGASASTPEAAPVVVPAVEMH